MKKQLLFGSALLFAVFGFSQNRIQAKPVFAVNKIKQSVINFNEDETPRKLNIGVSNNQPSGNQLEKDANTSNITATNISWKLIAGSRNTYGMGISQT